MRRNTRKGGIFIRSFQVWLSLQLIYCILMKIAKLKQKQWISFSFFLDTYSRWHRSFSKHSYGRTAYWFFQIWIFITVYFRNYHKLAQCSPFFNSWKHATVSGESTESWVSWKFSALFSGVRTKLLRCVDFLENRFVKYKISLILR